MRANPFTINRLQAFALLDDQMGPACMWPSHLRSIMTQQGTWRRKDRFRGLIFLLGNGVSPQLAMQFLDQVGAFHDEAARLDAIGMIDRYVGERWYTYNLILGRQEQDGDFM